MKFEIDKLASQLKDSCPEIDFALLHGSSAKGVISPGSDLDLALWLNCPISLAIYNKVFDAVQQAVGYVETDPGILNTGDIVYRFEALKGELLFARDQEQYLDFYSLTCRMYEDQMYRYEYQRRVRQESSQ